MAVCSALTTIVHLFHLVSDDQCGTSHKNKHKYSIIQKVHEAKNIDIPNTATNCRAPAGTLPNTGHSPQMGLPQQRGRHGPPLNTRDNKPTQLHMPRN